MMKKNGLYILTFLAVLFSAASVWAQTVEDQYQQYQQFSWNPVERAGKYEVDIEKKEADGTWKAAAAVQTRACRKEVLLYPGDYRVSIAAFTILGKKASASKWVEFTVLNETEPYLYDDYLKKSAAWNSPVLHINKTDPKAAADVNSSAGETETDDALVADEGDPANSFLLKAKNVFFPETKFYLVPVAESTSGGKPFEAYVEKRKNSPLTIVRRDRENGGIVVAYNSDELYSGYYNIVVENPGGMKASLCLLVLADRTPVIETDSFIYDANYKTSELSIIRDSNVDFAITGSGFDNNTTFTMKPTTEGIPYPFASALPRGDVPLTLKSRESLDDTGRMKLNFSIDASEMQTGYYRFTAGGGVGGTASLVLLVKMENNTYTVNPDITSISSNFNKKSNTVTFTMHGKNIDGASFVLISPFSSDGENKRIPLTQLDSKWGGSKLILDGEAANLETGTYALLVEKNGSTEIKYVALQNNYHAALATMTDDERDSKFLVPDNYTFKKSVEEEKPVQICLESNVVDVEGKDRYVLPYFMFDIDLQSSSILTLSCNLNVFDYRWFALKTGLSFSPYENNMEVKELAEFGLPTFKNFVPYAGLGVSCNFDNVFGTSIPNFVSLSAPFYVGVVVLQLLDFKYTCTLKNVVFGTGSMYFEDSYSMGCRIQLRQKNYIKKTNGFLATVSKTGVVTGGECMLDKSQILRITFENGATEVADFSEFPVLASVTLPNTLTTVGVNAFADDGALSQIEIPQGVTVIKKGAFKNCTNISSLVIPASVTTIENGAFEGWKSSQNIRLGWNSDDITVRDMSGLNGLEFRIYYNDGTQSEYGEAR
jgi:hypothetical protein